MTIDFINESETDPALDSSQSSVGADEPSDFNDSSEKEGSEGPHDDVSNESEGFSSTGEEASPPAPAGDRGGDSDTVMTKVALDWVELEAALENNSPELHSFLNTVTGDVIRVFEGTENSEARLKQAETSPDFIYIEPISSRDQYHWMEEFIEMVEEPTLKDKLNIAIDGKGAFRRFKDVLVGYPSERERWFNKRSARLRDHMQQWLKSKRVEATNSPPWEVSESESSPRAEYTRAPRHEGTQDLRARARELLDVVPTRELPIAVAFLEFLRNRRDPRHGRHS